MDDAQTEVDRALEATNAVAERIRSAVASDTDAGHSVTQMYHSIIGLPGTGKTTFLAALWHLIDAGEVSTRLVLDKLIGDHSYLNSIVEAWRRCEEVPRTSMAAEASVAVHLHEPAN